MKKIFMMAALVAAAAGANAQGSPVNNNGTLSVVVNDYITMVPNGSFAAGPMTFSTPSQMVNGNGSNSTGSGTVTIVASRSWNYKYSTSNFVRTGDDGNPNTAQTVAPGSIWFVGTSNPSNGGVWTTGGLWATSTTPTVLASQGTGTLSSSFSLDYALVPGLSNQMSGSYTADIVQVASLD